MIGWNFPGNQYTVNNGISESGIETFKGNPIGSLTREACQNSLDAVEDNSKPVYVEFEKIVINKDEIPGFCEFDNVIKTCYKYVNDEENDKSIRFFNRAMESISNNVVVLRISDYNTTGLIGSQDNNKKSSWRSLVKSNGISDKGAECGGSFGIGKSASFACSNIRTVFYRTKDKFDVRAVQGVAKLISFPREVDENGDMTTGIGYYGIKDRNRPIENCDILDKINNREKNGTDLFIFGFCGDDKWQKQIIGEILEEFMMSIYNGLLVVKVGNEEIGKDNLGDMIEKYSDYCSMVKEYYKVITEEGVECIQNFYEMGTLKLKILLDDKFSRTVLLTRSNGMKLFDLNRMPRSIQFSAILEMEGSKLNGFFRRMESPQHNAWEPARYEEDEKDAEKKLKELYKWIREQIKILIKCGDGNELDAEGVGDLIPDLFKEDNKKGISSESIGSAIKDIAFKIAETTVKSQETNEIEQPGTGNDDGQVSGKKFPQGKSNGGHGEGNDISTNVSGDGTDSGIKGGREIRNCNMRMYISNIVKNEYTLALVAYKDINNGKLSIKISGEQSSMDINVKEAHFDSQDLKCSRNVIKLGDLIKNKRNIIKFQLEDEQVYPLEVKLYES